MYRFIDHNLLYLFDALALGLGILWLLNQFIKNNDALSFIIGVVILIFFLRILLSIQSNTEAIQFYNKKIDQILFILTEK